MGNNERTWSSFTTDWEKMYDFWNMTKRDFLRSYSYLTQDEYDATCLETVNKKIEMSECPNECYCTLEEFIDCIREQFEGFKNDTLYSYEGIGLFNMAYEIVVKECLFAWFDDCEDMQDLYKKLIPYKDNLLQELYDFCYEDENNPWSTWDQITELVELFIKRKEEGCC